MIIIKNISNLTFLILRLVTACLSAKQAVIRIWKTDLLLELLSASLRLRGALKHDLHLDLYDLFISEERINIEPGTIFCNKPKLMNWWDISLSYECLEPCRPFTMPMLRPVFYTTPTQHSVLFRSVEEHWVSALERISQITISQLRWIILA